MKKLILFILSFSYLAINAQGINFFKGSFEEAKAVAKKEGKLIFMDAYASWCGPCKRMARDVFPKKEAGDFFNEKFINVKMDMEKGEGRSLASKYGVRSYPTLLFLDYTGEIVYQTRGARSSAQSLIQVGKQALKPSKKTLTVLEGKFKEGNRDLDFLKKYIQTKAAFNQNTNDVMVAFISELKPEDINDVANQKFIYDNTKNVNDIGIDFISKNKRGLLKMFGKEVFAEKINAIVSESVKMAIKNKSVEDITKTKSFLAVMKPKKFKNQMSFIDTKYYGLTKDWDNYDKAVSLYLNKYKKNDDKAYRAVAWNYYMNIDDTKKLAKAETWMQKAIKLNNSYKNNLTQSYLLYKMGEYSKAQDAVEYALILAKDSEKNTKNAQILKGKIEKALAGQKKDVVIDYNIK